MAKLTDERLLSMAAQALGYASIDPERGAEEGPGSFRQALEVFPEELIAFARAVLAVEPPAPVPVAEQPWKRPGWCDAEGRCWWGRCADDFFSPEWTMATLASIEEFCSDAMPQHCLPHWAIPVPANPTETTTTGDQ